MNEHTRAFDGSRTTYISTGGHQFDQARPSPRLVPASTVLARVLRQGRPWNAERPSGVLSSVRLCAARLGAENTEELCCRPSLARYAAWSRWDCRRSSKVLASPIPGHLLSYPIAPRFFHASHNVHTLT